MKNTDNYSEEVIFKEIEKNSSGINEGDLSNILSKERQFEKKSEKLTFDKFKKLLRQLKLSFGMLKDFKSKTYTSIPWRTISLLIAGILYFLNPFDIIPDFLPVIGYTDDAVAFAAIFKSIQGDLKKYCEWKGLNAEEYF